MTELQVNSSFSRALPGMQLAIDSTSLGAFKQCPRKYELSIVQGWSPRVESVHLKFGILLHKAREKYDHCRAAGANHDDALDQTLALVLQATWEKSLSRPWMSDHPTKHRVSLIRSIVWYLDSLGQTDPIETVQLANGRPAVELSFRFDSGITTSSNNESILFCGHLDRIGQINGDYYIVDIKTTGHQLSPSFFSGFSPDNQMSLYSLAGKVAFGFDVEGVIVDGVQVASGFTRFQRGPVPRDSAQLDEWYRDTAITIGHMEECASANYWPQNDKACGMYGGCEFREVCGRSPRSREAWLKGNYKKRIWDPLVVRGDI